MDISEIKSRFSFWMSTGELSRYLHDVHGIKQKPQTIAKNRCHGTGPAFEYRGRFPRTSQPQADAWAARRSTGPVRSTSEAKRLREQLALQVAAA